MLVLRADKDISYAQFFDIMTLGRSLGLDVWLVSDSSEASGAASGGGVGDDLD
jgi:biopolymer transport protein ExbD